MIMPKRNRIVLFFLETENELMACIFFFRFLIIQTVFRQKDTARTFPRELANNNNKIIITF